MATNDDGSCSAPFSVRRRQFPPVSGFGHGQSRLATEYHLAVRITASSQFCGLSFSGICFIVDFVCRYFFLLSCEANESQWMIIGPVRACV